MKNSSRFLLFALTIATLLLAACSGTVPAPTASPGGGKVEAIPVAFLGIVDSIAGDQWVINGQTVTVLPDVLRDGPFTVGDQIKVEGVVNADGSFTVSRVEAPGPQDSSTLPQFGDDNSNDANSNDSNINDDNSNTSTANDVNTNDDNSNGINSNGDNSNGVNSNDDANSNDDNANDESVDNSNSDDSNSNDDNSNSGGSNDNGSDDNGNGGGNDDNGGGGNDDNGNGG